jgi:hypothetical protein
MQEPWELQDLLELHSQVPLEQLALQEPLV